MDSDKQLSILSNIIQYSETADTKVNLDILEEIIFKKVPEALEKNAPPNFPELYFDFKQEYETFKSYILYDKLIGKTVVALGGGFSSGKSSFLNSIMNQSILPEDINPSTSVPTYIVNDNDVSAFGINSFNSKVNLDINDIKYLSHGFGKNSGGKEITLGHLLTNLFISVPSQPYKNIVMLDTPGYSKADSISYSAKTDEKIARNQLNSANYIVWFITADSGIITDSDVKFLQSIDAEIPVLVLINKADKIMPNELNEVNTKVRSILETKKIDVIDVLNYSSDEPDEHDRDKILMYFDDWNKIKTKNSFAKNFKKIFLKCKNFHEENLYENRKYLSRINKSIGYTTNESDYGFTLNFLNEIKSEVENKIKNHKEMLERLSELNNEFFKELNKISSIINIEMIEPSEIDLLCEKG